MEYTDSAYTAMIEKISSRFPSYQKVGGRAYKPGLDNMLFFDQLAGHPHGKYLTVHVAGTNGKGSVSNIIASVLAASGLRTGLYTSPHIIDFRERMKVIDGRVGGSRAECISRHEVWDFFDRWGSTCEHLDLSFFEITTMMAFDWFASENVDVAVIETGLGGRLDSTNIISPVLSIITNIGLDHCDILGHTLAEIAFEKAGIIKPGVPVAVGESSPETAPVFERKVLYTNLPDPRYMGDREKIMSLLAFADRTEPRLWDERDMLLRCMDLQGCYQAKNLRTVLTALDILSSEKTLQSHGIFSPLAELYSESGCRTIANAIVHTAERMEFRGRWEKACSNPPVIADIGHNPDGLGYNFSQLGKMKENGDYTDLIVVFGAVAERDLEAVFRYFLPEAEYVFTQASGSRAMPAASLLERYLTYCSSSGTVPSRAESAGNVADALARAFSRAREIGEVNPGARPLIFVGGSAYVVSEALPVLSDNSEKS